MTKVSKPPTHVNAFEHTFSFPRFVSAVTFFGILGALLGRTADKTVQTLKPNNRFEKGACFILQVILNAIILYIAFKVIHFDNLSFEDWIGGTFEGIVLISIYFSFQEELLINFKGAFF